MRSWTMGACHSPRWRQPLALVAANCGPLCTCKHLQLRMLCARWVPKDLTPQQRLRRVEDCTALLNMHDADSEAFFRRLVTGDESWLHCYDLIACMWRRVWHNIWNRFAPVYVTCH